MKHGLTIVCNLIVPGSGLIRLRREWFGLSIALLYAILAHAAAMGLLLVPATIPAWLTKAAVAAAALVWLGGQWQLWLRIRGATGSALKEEITRLERRAAEAVARNAYAEAVGLLQIALSLDDEDPAVNVQWAELMTLMGRFGPARRAWRRVAQLDRTGPYRRQANEALAALPVH